MTWQAGEALADPGNPSSCPPHLTLPAQLPLTIPLLSRNSALEKRGESALGGPGNPEDDGHLNVHRDLTPGAVRWMTMDPGQ